MIIPSTSVASSDDEALRGLLLSTLTALMKASKTNSLVPLQHLFRERLADKKLRRELNRALFAITTALSRRNKKEAQDNIKKAGVYDNVSVERKFTPQELDDLLRNVDYSDANLAMIDMVLLDRLTLVSILKDTLKKKRLRS